MATGDIGGAVAAATAGDWGGAAATPVTDEPRRLMAGSCIPVLNGLTVGAGRGGGESTRRMMVDASPAAEGTDTNEFRREAGLGAPAPPAAGTGTDGTGLGSDTLRMLEAWRDCGGGGLARGTAAAETSRSNVSVVTMSTTMSLGRNNVHGKSDAQRVKNKSQNQTDQDGNRT